MSEIDPKALYSIAYGLYVITSDDGTKPNGMICNTVVQVTNDPLRIAVTINKSNYTHDVVKQTGKMVVNVLDETAPFSVFERFGFQSGRTAAKFDGFDYAVCSNGLARLTKYSNAYFALKVESYTDLGTHGTFICTVEEAVTVSSVPTMTYTYYQANVKPKPAAKPAGGAKRRWVCKICGYVYEGDELPADFECPWCKHPASDFEEIVD